MTAVELGASALWKVAAAGLVFGAFSVLVFRIFADFRTIQVCTRRLIARLFELRLFADDPVLILRSQRDLLIENARILRAIALPCVILIAVSIPGGLFLNGLFGTAGLRVGEPSVLTVQLNRAGADHASDFRLSGSGSIRVETGGVRVPSEDQVSWRISPISAAAGEITLNQGTSSMTRRVAIGPVLAFSTLPSSSKQVFLVDVQYPPAVMYGESWVTWFCVFSFAGALLASVKFFF